MSPLRRIAIATAAALAAVGAATALVAAPAAHAATPTVSITAVDPTIADVGGEWGYAFGFIGDNAIGFSLKLGAPVDGATWSVTTKPALKGSRSEGYADGTSGTAYFFPPSTGVKSGTKLTFTVKELDKNGKAVASATTSWTSKATLTNATAKNWKLDDVAAGNGTEAFVAGKTYHLSGAKWPSNAKVSALVAVVDKNFNPLDGKGYLVAGNKPKWKNGYPVDAVKLKPVKKPASISFTVPKSAVGKWVLVEVDGQAPGKWDSYWIGSNKNQYAVQVVAKQSDSATYLKEPWAK